MNNSNKPLPVFFIGHGSPMNAIEVNEFTKGWEESVVSVGKPRAILCVSAHWETKGTKVCAVENPLTIHDFYGFPKALYELQYPAPGSPEYAKKTSQELYDLHVTEDFEWGLDHGSWSVLCHMYPLADVPVYQMSLDYSKPPGWHFETAKRLRKLRNEGVLIIGSGNIVHNLGLIRMNNPPFDWAVEFDSRIRDLILKGDSMSVVNYKSMGTLSDLAVPTNEHFLPLLYSLALRDDDEPVSFFNEETVYGSVSMRSLKIGM